MIRGVTLALAFTALAMVSLASPAAADHQRARVTLSATPAAKVEQGYLVSAVCRLVDGKAIGNATVRFYDIVELFGEREMYIGSATTDASGTATLLYLPAQTGTRRIVARFSGGEHVGSVESRMTLEATVAAPAYHAEAPGLALFSTRVPYAVGVVVLAVWALIAYAFLSTARGIKSGARIRKGDIA